MSQPGIAARRSREFVANLVFYTRLPLGRWMDPDIDLASTQWAAPLTGGVIGLAGGGVLLVLDVAELPATISAAACIVATIGLTGALHEDGLADTADGFGGGSSVSQKLDIMRDSRLGTYGVIALICSLLLRWTALSALAGTDMAFAAVIAAHSASRALIPAFVKIVPPARIDGLSARSGGVETKPAVVAGGLGLLSLLFGGIPFAIVCTLLLLGWLCLMKLICERQIGGQTGDAIGALQQVSEIIICMAAAAMLR